MSKLDLAAIRARLAGTSGPTYWRSLEELADGPGFRQLLQDEFPQFASVWPSFLSRRKFLGLMGASLALAGLGGCTQPPGEKIVPYVRTPEQIVPGKPLFFATAMTMGGVATGLLVESHLGRPTKVEGNPQHPGSQGATGPFHQASILDLYDPDRARNVTYQGEIRTYDEFVSAFRVAIGAERPRGGAGLRILTETVSSPTLAAQIRDVLKQFPQARWHQWEPCGPSDAARAGAQLAFGASVVPRYHFDRADTILALDADFLACTPANLRYVEDFAARRRVRLQATPRQNRLYAVEPGGSHTGAVADHRLPLRPSEVGAFAAFVASRLGVDVGGVAAAPPPHVPPGWVDALVRDLAAHRGSSLVLAGAWQPPAVHALAHAMNATLGNAGRTVTYAPPVEAEPVDQLASLRALGDDMRAGRVRVLLVLGGNPVYTAPADFGFKDALLKVAFPIHLSDRRDETSVVCRWHVPETHYLETWSDTRAWDGTATIVQPLIAPLYEGRSAHQVLAAFTPQPLDSSYNIVRAYWQSQHRGGDFEAFWRRALHDGVVPDTALPEQSVTPRGDWARGAAGAPAAPPKGGGDELEIVFRPHPSIWDGRFANNGWLQELPEVLTKVTWDNPALVSPATAERLGLEDEDVVELAYAGRTARVPVWILPGHADDAVTVRLGYGRTLAGRVGNGVGFDAYALRTSRAPWADGGCRVRKTGERHTVATSVRHQNMHGRDIVIAGTLDEYRQNPKFVKEKKHEERTGPAGRPLTLYPAYPYPTYAWGMAIDLTACTGCQACVMACYAENNIPVVGAEQVLIGRIMHWIRLDTYYTGGLENPTAYHQPLPCMQCEQAPCEVVCPVGATVHSDEGLNDMVYNRCVGTRYCSNNCPYKVRRFNFLQYADWTTPSLKLQRNPEVTVRSRGVMEKCTYCVQRITAARIEAEKEGRRVRDGEVITACAAACPTSAIVFGDLNDPQSHVSRVKRDPLEYALLDELGTRPRTTYLGAVRNRNGEIKG